MKKMIVIMGLAALGLMTLLAGPAQAYRVVDQQGRQQWICPRVPSGEPTRCEFFAVRQPRCIQPTNFGMRPEGRPTPAERPRLGRMQNYAGPNYGDMHFNCPWR